ncbi:PBSX family phage terminase large subunit [Inquilinus sp. Marseille-Q2685]|uniref:PBSX family phage terminase large subunit n=1 Tax=Inquilinus sp. Marseille-Q2685 TaxID=2866581 RepID=UPI001CE3F9D2|nr:PBSX family phage terminase large subunit [Inquilinus sp. Marseille-Q2685]
MPTRPRVLILCLAAVAGRRRRGERLPERIRRLTGAAEARLAPGAGQDAAELRRLEQAYQHFRRELDKDGEEDAPPALPLLELAPAFRPLQRRCRYKGAYGGRGSGKSHVFAELLVRRCVEGAPVRAVCIRGVQRSLDQSVKRLIEDKIQALGLGSAFRVQADRILGPGGGRIIFQGMQNHTAESIKSLEGYDIAWVEEAQALSIRSLDLLRPTIRKPGSELWFSWNPVRPDDPVDALFRGGPLPPDCELVPVNWSDNPHFPEVLKAEMEWDRQRDPEKHQHVWLGGYRRVSEARVFTNWKVEAFETPAGARFLFGADWGFARDPTVLVRCFVQGRTLFVDHEAYQVGCEIDRTPALFDTVPGARRGPIIADSARPETISYMQRQGFGAIKGSAKGPGSVEEGVEFLKAHDILVHPRCRHLIDELALYSYRTDPKTGVILSELEDRGNHAVDALRYAVEGQRRSTYDTSMKWV